MPSFRATLPSNFEYFGIPETAQVKRSPTSLSTSSQLTFAVPRPRLPASSTTSCSMLSPESFEPPQPAPAPSSARQATAEASARVVTPATLPARSRRRRRLAAVLVRPELGPTLPELLAARGHSRRAIVLGAALIVLVAAGGWVLLQSLRDREHLKVDG